jgi:putative ATP-dependent endonuclease of the OLD family
MPPNAPTKERAEESSDGILVDTVRIANFRSLKNVEISLSATTILLGMNNAGKTSFLRALHLALGADRRILTPDDFHLGGGNADEAREILIDFRIIPVNSDGERTPSFSDTWIESDFGGDVPAIDSQDQQFVAVRTRITFDAVKSDFIIDRRLLKEWPSFDGWQTQTVQRSKVSRRFERILSFFIDAQRDVVADLRSRSSYVGKLLSKIDISEESIQELEEQLRTLNENIVAKSEVLAHIRSALTDLNATVPSFGQGVEVTPVSKKLRDITKGLGVQFNDSATSSFPLESHGMGTRSWASLLTYRAYVSWMAKRAQENHLPFHPILSLEEPEAHLHPNAQRCVYQQLHDAVGQKIVSTHSPYIAGQAELADIRHFCKDGSETRIASLDSSGLSLDDHRKIRREVMRTRGELLFARAVVLFEGETEEQALPLFATHQWEQFPYERGVAFVGVGGDGNYLPFLRVFESLRIPWFIFSDGEPNAKKSVESAMKGIGQSLHLRNKRLIILPGGESIEQYLLAKNYQTELKQAVIEFHRPFCNDQHEEAKKREIRSWDDVRLLEFMEGHKTGLSAYWAAAILERRDSRNIPHAVRYLFTRIEKALHPGRKPKP